MPLAVGPPPPNTRPCCLNNNDYLHREGEDLSYRPYQFLHNRVLLSHGTRMENVLSILSKGLRVAPTEAPSSGSTFGKGSKYLCIVTVPISRIPMANLDFCSFFFKFISLILLIRAFHTPRHSTIQYVLCIISVTAWILV